MGYMEISEDKREHIDVEEMRNFTLGVLRKAKYPEDAAKSTTHALLDADIKGIFSHGIAGGTGLEEAVKRTGITASVEPTSKPIVLKQQFPTIAVIDGNGAPGHLTAQTAVDLVKELARKYGIAKVFVNNTNHYGAAGTWSEKISLDGDLKGEVSCTTVAVAKVMGDDPKRLDYTKGAGKEVRMGTNPLAISIPHTDGILTFDSAWTRMAVSYCLKHLKAGEMMSIPEYIADNNYNSTLNPQDFMQSVDDANTITGSVFPQGSTNSGYKGDSMLRFLEIDQTLGGGPLKKISFEGTGGKRRISHSFQAQVIDFLFTKEEAKARVRELMIDYETKYFGSASRWPGDRSNKAKQYCMNEGIPYSKGQIKTLKRAANYVDLDFRKLINSRGHKNYPRDIFNK